MRPRKRFLNLRIRIDLDNKLLSCYAKLNRSLIEMKEEYKLTPSKVLLKKIELADSKLKQIDSLIGKSSSSGGGNYQSTFSDNTNFSL